jgi:hypothetical protein
VWLFAANGSTLSLTKNGVLVCSTTDSTYTSGGYGASPDHELRRVQDFHATISYAGIHRVVRRASARQERQQMRCRPSRRSWRALPNPVRRRTLSRLSWLRPPA